MATSSLNSLTISKESYMIRGYLYGLHYPSAHITLEKGPTETDHKTLEINSRILSEALALNVKPPPITKKNNHYFEHLIIFYLYPIGLEADLPIYEMGEVIDKAQDKKNTTIVVPTLKHGHQFIFSLIEWLLNFLIEPSDEIKQKKIGGLPRVIQQLKKSEHRNNN